MDKEKLKGLSSSIKRVYDNMNDVIKENPTFKGQPIRGVCNGSKKLLMDLFGDTLIQMELLKNKI